MNQKKTKFIGIAGRKQTGKDTSGNILVKLLTEKGLSAKITHFAAPLKEFCINVLGLPREKVYGSDADKNELSHLRWETLPNEIRHKYRKEAGPKERTGIMTVREVLQIVGSDVVREMLWNDAWSTYPFRQDWKEDVIICVDTRFINECDEILKAGGTILRLERAAAPLDNHMSETALDNYNFDFKYENNGTLVELEQYLAGFLNATL